MAANFLTHHSELDSAQTILTIAVPVGVFALALFTLRRLLLPERDLLHLWLLPGTLALLVASYALAAAGAPLTVSIVIVVLAPWVTVLGHELRGVSRPSLAPAAESS